ncbi:MAG: LpqB family beta-propeller domain-containing protein [Microbacterium sp.]
MIRLRGIGAVCGALLLAAVLAACGGLPTSGPVNAGQSISEDTEDDLVFLPDGPSTDATPQQIVEGFIAAGSGPGGNWETARQFLATDTEWNPGAGVIVYSPGERSLEEVDGDEFVLSVTPVATVDSDGELSTAEDTGEITLSFTLAQQDDGQWRITEAPDGIVLDSNLFGNVYGSYALQFFDPTWTYLVADTRWFPRVYAATSIAEALVDNGPSAWLEGAVATAFTDGARLAQVAVPVTSNVAAVSLQDGARDLDQTVLDRMQTQLEESLAAAGIDEVDMLVDDQPLAADAVDVRSTTVDTRPLVRTSDDFGFLSGSSVEEIAGLSAAILQLDATDIEVDADQTTAAVRTSDGIVLAVSGDGTDPMTVDDREGLVAPSIDSLGWVWSVPQSDPSAVVAVGADGTIAEIAEAWTGATQILAQRVSREGTRIAAVVRDGDGYALWVAGIQRDRDGAPTGLGENRVLARLPGLATTLAWLDDTTIVALTTDDGDPVLYTQEVGGLGSVESTPDDVVAVAGVAQSGGVRLRDAAGELYGQRGANWQHLGSDVLVLAVQQGSPD